MSNYHKEELSGKYSIKNRVRHDYYLIINLMKINSEFVTVI